jgi:hypothetical protein
MTVHRLNLRPLRFSNFGLNGRRLSKSERINAFGIRTSFPGEAAFVVRDIGRFFLFLLVGAVLGAGS